MINFQERWTQLAGSYCRDQELIDRLWREIEKAYTASGRHYHNLAHLEQLLGLTEVYSHKLLDKDLICFSIFYHDIIYNVKRKDNEEMSALFAGNRLRELGLPEEKIEQCKIQIKATSSHETSDDSDINYLLDFDLSILGAPAKTYQEYTIQIRKEYSIYPNFLYRKGRKKVVRHFLGMPQIFKTSEFISEYEPQARENLKRELEQL